MSNQLSMVRIHDILTLVSGGLSQRQVAKKLQIHRQTVGRYLRLARQGIIHPDGTVHAGSKSTEAPIGTDRLAISKSSKAPTGNFGQKSGCEPFRTMIETKIQQRLTAQRIWQDLKLEQGLHRQLLQCTPICSAVGRVPRTAVSPDGMSTGR